VVLDLRECGYDQGACGLVFFINNKNKAIKVFFNKNEVARTKNVFLSETNAYLKAQKCSKAKLLTPHYYGKVKITRIIDSKGMDISNKYHMNLAYKMSYESGCFSKLGYAPEKEQLRIKEIFTNIGVNFMQDSSVILSSDKVVIKVIDFAVREYEPWA
jgi:quinolinate synthase